MLNRHWTGCLLVLVGLFVVAALPCPAEPQVNLREEISLQLVKADLVEVLTTVARILGASAEIDPAIGGTVSVDMTGSSIEYVLNGLCALNDCRWTLSDDDGRVLRVRVRGEKIDPISIELLDADLRETLTAFSVIAGATASEIDPELSGTISVHLDRVPWVDALDAVCARAGCSWRFEEGPLPTLVILARSVVTTGDLGTIELSGRQRSPAFPASAKVLVGVSFQAPRATFASEELADFSLKRPVLAVRSGRDEVWEARLVWISFGDLSRWLLPLLVRCGAEDEARVVELETVTLPLKQPWRGEAAGASLSLSVAPAARRQPMAGPPATDCYPTRPVRVSYSYRDGARGSTVLDGPGNYLQVTATGTPDDPLATLDLVVVVVGTEQGGVRLKLFSEGSEWGLKRKEGWVGPNSPWIVSGDSQLPVDLEISLAEL